MESTDRQALRTRAHDLAQRLAAAEHGDAFALLVRSYETTYEELVRRHADWATAAADPTSIVDDDDAVGTSAYGAYDDGMVWSRHVDFYREQNWRSDQRAANDLASAYGIYWACRDYRAALLGFDEADKWHDTHYTPDDWDYDSWRSPDWTPVGWHDGMGYP